MDMLRARCAASWDLGQQALVLAISLLIATTAHSHLLGVAWCRSLTVAFRRVILLHNG